MKIFYKLDQASGQMIVYAEKVVRADILNLIAVIAEAELMPDFVPNMISSKIVLEQTHFRKLCVQENKMLWPFSNRVN